MIFNPLNLAILDDQALFRRTLSSFLVDNGNFNVCIEAADVLDLIDKLQRTPVDVLLVEIFSSQMKGDRVVKMIRERFPSIKILIVSVSTDIHLISDMVDAGVHGYVSKFDEPEELLAAVQAVKENRIYHNKLFTEALYFNKQNAIPVFKEKSLAALGDREKKILQLLWDEKSNKEIAHELFLGVRTVERIRQDMKEKIGAKSTTGLIKFAIQNKIITDIAIDSRRHEEIFYRHTGGRGQTTYSG